MGSRSSDTPKKRSKAFSGNHQRSWLWGHHAVTETLLAGKWPVVEVFVTQEIYDQALSLMEKQVSHGVPVSIVSSDRIEQLTGASDHQGLAARLGAFPYLDMDHFENNLRRAIDEKASQLAKHKSLSPLVVICDRIQDAFNFGSILRCCDGAGVAGVIVGERFQSEVTPHVVRSSSGAVNYVPIAKSNDLIAAVHMLQRLGLQVVAADANGKASIWETPLHSLTAIVIGSEAMGVCPELLDLCDLKVTIPMCGQVASLNAAVAAGILLYEVRRQQQV